MDFHKREELISQRMTRHRIKWQAYQQEAYRRKIRKAYFENMKNHMRMIREHRRKMQERQREYMRKMAFSKMMSGLQTQSTGMMMGGSHTPSMGMMYSHGGFGANSVFTKDNRLKRRRLREMIYINSDEKKSKVRKSIKNIKNKVKKLRQRKKDQRDYRKMDETEIFEEANDDDAIPRNRNFQHLTDLELDNEEINPSPKRCIILTADSLYELCINDKYAFVTKYIKKLRKPHFHGYLEEDAKYVNHIRNSINGTVNDSTADAMIYDEDNMMDFEGYENEKYSEAMHIDYYNLHDSNGSHIENGIQLKKIAETATVIRIDEFIYNYENNHRKQCFVDRYPYRLCMEYSNLEMVLHFGIQDSYIRDGRYSQQFIDNTVSFNHDFEFDEIDKITRNNDRNQEIRKEIRKCIHYGDAKFCLIEYIENGAVSGDQNEYRATIMTKLKDSEGESQESDPSEFAFFQ